jgi:hypothetical protein
MSLENITDRCFWNGLNTSFHSGNTNRIGGKGDCFCPNLANCTNAKTGFRKVRAVIQNVPLKCMKKFHLLLDTVEWRSHEMNAWIFTFTYRQSSSNRRGSTQACGSTWCLPQIEAQQTTHIPVKRPCSIVLHVTICCGGGWEIHHHAHAVPIKGQSSMNSMCEH